MLVEEINNYDFTKIAELILGIQISLCEVLKSIQAKDEEWFENNSIAYEEIATVDNNNQIIPNSRFLKILIHNLGEYLVTSPQNIKTETLLFEALQKALSENIFYQKICVFRTTDNQHIRFDGIADKVCPARSPLAKICLSYFTSRLVD
jgi:hypothetical protein